jgi:ectoine hydroxylase-related dioxygenase (phytanoyl-CoA dioxygenase family)
MALLPVRSTSAPSAAEEALLTQQAEHFMAEGYVILRGVLSDEQVAAARAMLDLRIAVKLGTGLGEIEVGGKPATGEEFAAAGRTIGIGGPHDSALIGYPGMLASAPDIAGLLIKPFLLSPRLLDLAERVMGPFVQGDGFYVQGTPPPQLTGGPEGVADRAELLAEAAGWHRDAYSHHSMWSSGSAGYRRFLVDGTQPYTPPLAAHMLCYLQDMGGPGGPLLAVPRSHRNAFGSDPAGKEGAVLQIDAKAGDVVFFHCDMLHSGSRNRAADGAWRYMVTSFIVRVGLPHRDDFTQAPLVQALIAEAKATGDRRVLRFFRADDTLRREREHWRAVVEEERRLLRSAL